MYEYDPELATRLVLGLLIAAACITAASVAIDAIRWLREK